MREHTAELANWIEQDEDIAMATVVWLHGSSLRPTGSRMFVSASGAILGSVSGGCLEGAVIEECRQVLETRRSSCTRYEPAGDDAWRTVSLPCGGTVEVYVEPLREVHTEWIGAMRRGAPVALITDLTRHTTLLVGPDGRRTGDVSLSEYVPSSLAAASTERIRPSEEAEDREDIFIQVFPSPPTLTIVGAVHVARELTRLAPTLGFRTRVIDPRRAFATHERFVEADELVVAWPQDALSPDELEPQDAVAILSHDAKLDLPALRIALQSEVGYIGLLGSHTTQEKRKVVLREEGVVATKLQRIHGPIGLNLGAQTPAEIALAILAEIVAVQHNQIDGNRPKKSTPDS